MLNNLVKSLQGALSSFNDGSKKVESKKPVTINKKIVDKKSKSDVKQKAKAKVIRRTEDIPEYSSLLRGTIAIGEEKSSQYAVLLLKESDDKVLILCSEQTVDFAVDNSYLNIARQCKQLGYEIKRAYATKDVIEIINEKDDSEQKTITEEEKGPVHDRLREIFRAAKEFGTSDVHIEVRKGGANIYLRIDGDKEHYRQIKENVARTIARVAYSSLGKDKDVTFNERRPQDAKIDMMLDGENVSIRLATIPATPSGFDMVLRILPAEAKEYTHTSFKELGYSEEHVKLLEIANAIPVGVIVLSGVTGSGKTTSLTSMINNKMIENDNKLKAITIEDPPEVIMKNVTQAPVVRRKGEESTDAFAELMRATLRCDPDVLMPGEIRDNKTGSLLVSAVQSGHQVFTTLHAPSAIGSIDRMREIGIRSNILGSHDFISALVYQSLVPINCEHCSIDYKEYLRDNNAIEMHKKEELIERVVAAASMSDEYDLSKVRFKSKKGCISCGGRGIIKREVIAEVIIPDTQMKKYFKEEKDAEAKEYYRKCGGKLILDHGLDKMFEGKIDPASLERKAGRMDMSEYSMDKMLKKIREDIGKKNNSVSEKPNGESVVSSLNLELKKDSASVIDLKRNK